MMDEERVRLVRLRPRRHGVRDAEPALVGTRYLPTLGRLSAALEGIRWAVAGGLAVPMTLGAFYRRHHDLDVVVPLEGLGAMAEALRPLGFGLYWRVAVWAGRQALDVHVPCPARLGLARLRARKLRFVQRGEGVWDFGSVIDVYPYVERAGELVTCDRGRLLPTRAPAVGHWAGLESGARVPCFDLRHVHWLKGFGSSPIHAIDRLAIEEGPDAARAALRRQERHAEEQFALPEIEVAGPSGAPLAAVRT